MYLSEIKTRKEKNPLCTIFLPEKNQKSCFIGLHSHKSRTNHTHESTVVKTQVKDLRSCRTYELITLHASFASEPEKWGIKI